MHRVRARDYGVAMTLTEKPVSTASSHRGKWVIGASVALMLVAGGIGGATYYFDSVPVVETAVAHPVVEVAAIPEPVVNAFVAAVDPDFYESTDSLLTRRFAVLAAGEGDESSLRARVMARKFESMYAKPEILERYLNRAGYGRGATGLVAAARTYFQKAPAQLTVAEAAFLAVQVHPDRPAAEDGWKQVLATMVERGWLSTAERDGLVFPG